MEGCTVNDRALAVVQQGSLVTYEAPRFDPTPEQQKMIRDSYARGASPQEFEVLLEISRARNLNPLLRQVHYVSRKDKKLNKEVWSVQISIDGLRAVAERTRQYDGQDEPEFEHNAEGLIVLARVKVYKKGISRPFVGVARWDEYVQTTYEGQPTKFWKDMPYTMLGKCAEALAIRKAFPEDSGGLYVAEELMQGEQPKQMEDPRRGAISPHESSSNVEGDPDLAAALLDRLEQALLCEGERFTIELDKPIQTPLKPCKSYDDALAMRAFIGTKAKLSDWAKAYQAARENLNGLQNKLLGKVWNYCDRQIAKLEKELATSAEDTAHTDPAEDFDR